jgi:SAM-dependent methyltransferase
MEIDYKSTLRQNILDQTNFLQATFTGHQKGELVPYIKAIVRPIVIKTEYHIQFEYYDANKVIHKNYKGNDIIGQIDEILKLSFRNIYLKTKQKGIQVQITKKGKALVREHQNLGESEINLSHDRNKARLISADEHTDYLKAIGFMTQDGVMKASMHGKFRQVNEFLKNIEQTGEIEQLSHPINIIDCGCGNAYLTFSTYYYLNNVLNLPTYLTGIDINAGLMEKHSGIGTELGWDNIKFEVSDIASFKPTVMPQIVLALHACDTATDEAIAQAIKWQSHLIFSVPCCHQNLQQQFDKSSRPAIFEPVCEHGILKERLADLITDTFRALLLNIMGYKVSVIQFVSSEHTAKNVMIRAIRSASFEERSQAIDRYKNLKQFWQVEPYLEKLLSEELASIVAES